MNGRPTLSVEVGGVEDADDAPRGVPVRHPYIFIVHSCRKRASTKFEDLVLRPAS